MTSTVMADDAVRTDAPLPVQFEQIWHRSRAISPERALALAVLEQAVADLRKFRFATRRRQQRLYIEAYRWVAANERSWPYSFASLCDVLGFDVAAMRSRLFDLAPPETGEVEARSRSDRRVGAAA
jgi:hypothetical protein